ncbi:MAG: beta-lactamase family protein [Actinobacteria bacterium]|nr:beta-lactamase family protein [Actinomycetota bacterium]
MTTSRIAIASLSLAVGLAVSTVSVGPAFADTRPGPAFSDTLEAARDAAADVLKETGASSISFSLVDGKRTVWSTTVGAIDENGTKPTASTLYGIGSVTKTFTAIAVMQLVDAGKVSLDAPVTDYVTDFTMASPEYRQVTVRMLLNHSAGFPGTDASNGITSTPYPGYAQQVLDTLATSTLKTTPGSMSVYCNDCFTLAGILVERMSGLSYTDYVQQRILTPLKMRMSLFPTTPLSPGSYAPIVTDAGALPPALLNVYASGGLLSTPTDLGRLAAMLMNGGTLDGVRILSSQAIKEMSRNQLTSTLTAGPPQFRYGLGWDTVTEPGLAAAGVDGWNKGGDTPQYHAAFTLAPKEDVAAAVLAVGTGVSSAALAGLAQRIVLSALVEKGVIAALPEPLATSAPRAVAPTPAQTADMAGIYLAAGSALRVAPRSDGALSLAVYQGGTWVTQPSTLTRRSDGQYWADGPSPAALSLTRGWGRTFLALTRPGGMGTYHETILLGQKVTSVDVLSPAWQQRVGQTWLNVNERADSILWQELPTLTLAQVPGLTGYLWVADLLGPAPVDPQPSDDVATMFLTIPIVQGRDLNDLHVLNRTDGEWVSFGGALYRPLSTVPAITERSANVTIGPDGYAEWRTVPTGGTLAIRGNGSWRAFSVDGAPAGAGDADGAEISASAGARIAFFGRAGTVLELRYRN